MAAKFNLDVRKGDTLEKSVTWKNKGTGLAVNLTGATLDGGVTKGTVTIPFVTLILAAAEGKFRFGLSATTTGTLAVGKYEYFLRVTFADQTVDTLLTGQFVVYA